MSNSYLDFEVRALEREARTAQADLEELVKQLAALPTDARTAIRARIESDRSRLEAIAARAERALDEQRVDLSAKIARLEGQLEGHVDELERRRIEGSKAEIEAAFAADRAALENARSCARDAVSFSAESLGRYSLALEARD